MKAIRLRNLRALGDTGDIELRPITLLLGQNSSGKSTALRALPLLKQSIRTRSNAPVLWYGDLVDFGSAREVKSTLRPAESIGFEFDFGNLIFPRSRMYYRSTAADSSRTRFSLSLDEMDGKTRLKHFSVQRDDDSISIELDQRGAVSQCVVNNEDLTRMFNDRVKILTTSLIPQVVNSPNPDGSRRSMHYPMEYRPIDSVEREIKRFFVDRLPKRVREATVEELMYKLSYRSGERFSGSFDDLGMPQQSVRALFDRLKMSEARVEYNYLRSLYMLFDLPSILVHLNGRTERMFSSVSYVGPSRATGERYYRMQELAVDQIDPQGRNLAMFLNSLSVVQQRQFSEWLTQSFGYSFRVERSTGHIQLHLREANSEKFYNLADMGYGFSQVLPIMAEIWARQFRRGGASGAVRRDVTIAIEQPELHLHPEYQARLAEVFVRSIASGGLEGGLQGGVKFLIETHSEALVNRLGALIFEKKISPESVAVYVFEKKSGEETTIRPVHYDDEGILQNWPYGFFSTQ